MFMFLHKDGGQNRSINITNKSIKTVSVLKF
jgi:hypothetical protein